MSEILAPAGNYESAMAAINAGADAIYIGLKQFSARAGAENFDAESFQKILGAAKFFNVKVYVAMNTLVKDDEVESFLDEVLYAWNSGADAIIISDIFLGKFIKLHYPQIILHLSTQAGVCNLYGANLAKEFGFDRVILSRETTLSDIKAIAQVIETEVFVQGALCTCFSGQCYASSFFGGNSGNRGRCKQPCRKRYSIDRQGFDTLEYRLSLSDLSVGERIRELADANVLSFKIEGRMRRPEYVSAAVRYYKKILADCAVPNDLSALKRTYNRGNYTQGLAFGQDKNFISSAVQGHIGEFVGNIKVINGEFFCESSQTFTDGDAFKILRKGTEVGGADFSRQAKNEFFIKSRTRLLNGDKVFITTDTSLNNKLLSEKRASDVVISAEFKVGQLPKIILNGLEFLGQDISEAAKNSALTEDEIRQCFSKVDGYPFRVVFSDIETDRVFIPKSRLNELRRQVFYKFFCELSKNTNAQLNKSNVLPDIKRGQNEKVAVISRNLDNLAADIGILKPKDYMSVAAPVNFKGIKLLYLPPYMSTGEAESLAGILEDFDGVYGEGSWAIGFAEKFNLKLFCGTGLNISNRVDLDYCKADFIALSKELSLKEQAALSASNTFALAAGGIKIMDLIYCPFGKKCSSCDRRDEYVMTDEQGRKFPLMRYKTSQCRFEIYNCADLVSISPTGTLADLTGDFNPAETVKIIKNEEKLKLKYKNYTRGHSNSPII